MLSWLARNCAHVVPEEARHPVYFLGIRIAEGCGVCSGVLVFRSGGPCHPGLGLKLGFRRWDRDGLHRQGGVMGSGQRLHVGGADRGVPAVMRGRLFVCQEFRG